MKMLKSILLMCCLVPCAAIAQNPGSAYVKNSGSKPLHIWVNGSYQGYVRPNETRYSVSDGFITNDSGNGHDGKPVKESHGGWDNDSSGKVKITYQFGDGEKKTREVPVNERGEAIIGVTDKEGAEPKPPTDEEREAAAAIIKGAKSNLKKTGPEQTSDSREDNRKTRFIGKWSGTDEYGNNYTYNLRPDGTFVQTISGEDGSRSWKGTWEVDNNSSVALTEMVNTSSGIKQVRHENGLVLQNGVLVDNSSLPRVEYHR